MKTIQNRQLDLLSGNFVSEIKISYFPVVKPSNRPIANSSRDTYDLVIDSWPSIDYTESFGLLLLNRANRVLGLSMISTGGTTSCIVDPKVVFQNALKANASGIVLLHNHPSGSTHPSAADIDLTRKLVDGGKILEIQVLDHLILTSESYYSFADNGRI